MKKNISLIYIAAFALLLLVKILISGLYLKGVPLMVSTTKLAMAQEKIETDVSINKMEEALKVKDRELKEQEKRLNKMEQELLPLKKEVDQKLEELNELQIRLTAYAKELATREKILKDTKIAHLVALYSSMDPAKAAGIMDKLSIDIVVRILGNMKGKSAGKILAMLAPEKGATISESLSKMD